MPFDINKLIRYGITEIYLISSIDISHNFVVPSYQVKGKKVKISLLQAVEAYRVVRGQGSHIT
jgi:hypothetical protein